MSTASGQTHVVLCQHLLGPITGPHEDPGHDFQESLVQASLAVLLELCRRYIARDGIVVGCGLQVLTEGENIDVGGT